LPSGQLVAAFAGNVGAATGTYPSRRTALSCQLRRRSQEMPESAAQISTPAADPAREPLLYPTQADDGPGVNGVQSSPPAPLPPALPPSRRLSWARQAPAWRLWV